MVQKISPEDSMRLDHALQRVLMESGDKTLAAEFDIVQAALSSDGPATENLDPPTVIAAVFAHIIPHISNPAVLLPGPRRTILKRLEARMSSHGIPAPVVPGGLETIRHEIANMDRFLKAANSLIGG